jgi:DNA-binding NarL/FixJ family response regulator
MVSVLFVDDNIMGLRGLRETFSGCNESWETAFAPGAEVALHIMAERPVDAVVASTRLSGVSAANFLRMAKVQFPKTARIALSNPGDRGAMLSALPVAKQCLSKACGPYSARQRRRTHHQAAAQVVQRSDPAHGGRGWQPPEPA